MTVPDRENSAVSSLEFLGRWVVGVGDGVGGRLGCRGQIQ